MDKFILFGIPMDTYCVSHDIDDYDLFGEIMEENEVSDFADNILLN